MEHLLTSLNLNGIYSLYKIGEEIQLVKDAVNQEIGNQYASLQNVIHTLRPYLQKHGLRYLQRYSTRLVGDGVGVEVAVKTIVFDKDGNEIDSMNLVSIVPSTHENVAQGIASTITYFRRISLILLFNLIPMDDDGNAAAVKTERLATPNQLHLISRLVKEGKIPDRDYSSITLAEASRIITEALR